jgi:hypothetical protein
VSVRLRITVLAALLTTVAIAIGGTVLVTSLRSSLIEAADVSSRTRANELASAAAKGQLPESIANIAEEGVAQVVTDDGTVLAASENVHGEERISAMIPRRGAPV